MPLDVVLFDIQMPTLLPIFAIALIFQILINRILSDIGAYDYIWHPGLFRIALFVITFTVPCFIIYH